MSFIATKNKCVAQVSFYSNFVLIFQNITIRNSYNKSALFYRFQFGVEFESEAESATPELIDKYFWRINADQPPIRLLSDTQNSKFCDI